MAFPAAAVDSGITDRNQQSCTVRRHERGSSQWTSSTWPVHREWQSFSTEESVARNTRAYAVRCGRCSDLPMRYVKPRWTKTAIRNAQKDRAPRIRKGPRRKPGDKTLASRSESVSVCTHEVPVGHVVDRYDPRSASSNSRRTCSCVVVPCAATATATASAMACRAHRCWRSGLGGRAASGHALADYDHAHRLQLKPGALARLPISPSRNRD